MDSAEQPKMHREDWFLAAKTARLDAPHIAPLSDFVRNLRRVTGGEVPFFDPDSGGTAARALLLYEAPGARSTSKTGSRAKAKGSGMISIDNNDETAAESWRLYQEADLDRRRILAWNIVPWYLGSATKIVAPGDDDLAKARPYLAQLLELLPDLRVVVAVGTPALKGWKRYLAAGQSRRLATLACPHPSPTNMRTRPHYRPIILDTFRQVAAIVDA